MAPLDSREMSVEFMAECLAQASLHLDHALDPSPRRQRRAVPVRLAVLRCPCACWARDLSGDGGDDGRGSFPFGVGERWERRMKPRIDFDGINAAALAALPWILDRWLPGGRRQGREYVCRNPKRADRSPGSFKVNLATGRWADFAAGDAGGDPISLAAYLHDINQAEAARRLAAMLGIAE